MIARGSVSDESLPKMQSASSERIKTCARVSGDVCAGENVNSYENDDILGRKKDLDLFVDVDSDTVYGLTLTGDLLRSCAAGNVVVMKVYIVRLERCI